MERKIFNSDESRIKRSFDGFKQRSWQLRSVFSTYKYDVSRVDFCGNIALPGFIKIYDMFYDKRIVPACMI